MSDSLQGKIIYGVKWSSISYFGRRVISVLANIVLARLLAPEDFGIIAMASVLLGFIDLFRDLGTGSAIIQKNQINEGLLSSLFWINLMFGLSATAIVCLISPLIGQFYHEEKVVPIIRIMSFSFTITSLGIVQSSVFARDLNFSRLAKIELGSALFAAGTGVTSAVLGAGVWSIVFQSLTGNVMSSAWLWIAGSWRPRLLFHFKEVRTVMHYSLNLTGANIFNYFARNADNLLIGRYLGAESLGYYDLAYRLMLYPLQSISAVISRVMFPVYSKIQDDGEMFRKAYLSVAASIAMISFPLMLGLMAVAKPFVAIVFGAKWMPIVPLLLIFAPLGAVQSISTTVGSIYQAKGRTDLMLGWCVGTGILYVSGFVICLRWGVIGVAAGYAALSALLTYPGFVIPFRLVKLRVKDLSTVLWRPVLCSLLMLVPVVALIQLFPASWPAATLLPCAVATGIVSMVVLTCTLNRKQFHFVLNAIWHRA